MDSQARTVDEYIQSIPEERQQVISDLRELVRQIAPQAVESMNYRMPTYENDGEMFCAIASQKHYMSLYTDVTIVEQYRDEMPHLNIGKSCIRFKKAEDLPLDIVKKILTDVVAKQAKG